MNSTELKIEIVNFKSKFLTKKNFWKYEKNKFDLIIDSFHLLIIKTVIYILKNRMIDKSKKNLLMLFEKLLNLKFTKKRITPSLENYELMFNKFKKYFEENNKLLEINLEENKKLKNDIRNLNSQFEVYKVKNFSTDKFIGHNSSSKIDFYQDENIRISSELNDVRKKFDIIKKELEKYEKEKINLISKINSVNEVLNNNNILTTVFENDVKKINKVEILNPQENKKNNFKEIENEVKMIFSKNK